MRSFRDRREAGRALAQLLEDRRGTDAVVLGLPRGGVVVAAEIARHLALPLDVLLVRKLGHPLQPELAMGAVGEDGIVVWNDDVLAMRHVDEAVRERVLRTEQAELTRRAELYRVAGRQRAPLANRTAVIVDDGIATGATARAAVLVARAHDAREVVLATPVLSEEARPGFEAMVDELVAARTPRHFGSVGAFYRDFTPTSDDEVLRLLAAV